MSRGDEAACERTSSYPARTWKGIFMLESLRHLQVGDGDLVDADHMLAALTAGTLVFGDGPTQVFTSDGRTTYNRRWASQPGRLVGRRRWEVRFLLAAGP